jgi:hypothetical protein
VPVLAYLLERMERVKLRSICSLERCTCRTRRRVWSSFHIIPVSPDLSAISSSSSRTSAHLDLACLVRSRSPLYFDFNLDFALGPDSGWLQTDMGNRAAEAAHLSEAPHTLKEGVDAMIELLDKANREEHGGKFLAYGIPGGALPW